jgi:hypothetical protein
MDDEYDRQEAASSSSSAVCSKCNSGMTAVAELAVEAGIGGGGGYTSFTDSTHRCISLTVLECCGTGVASDSSAVVRGGEGSSPALSELRGGRQVLLDVDGGRAKEGEQASERKQRRPFLELFRLGWTILRRSRQALWAWRRRSVASPVGERRGEHFDFLVVCVVRIGEQVGSHVVGHGGAYPCRLSRRMRSNDPRVGVAVLFQQLVTQIAKKVRIYFARSDDMPEQRRGELTSCRLV